MISSYMGGASIAMIQHYGQGFLTVMTEKSMDQGKEEDNMFTQEAVWEL